jgi:hypothetical protein
VFTLSMRVRRIARRALLATWLAASAVTTLRAPECAAQPCRSAREEHRTIAAIRGALASWLTAPERQRLAAVDTTSTCRGSTRVLMLLAADRVVRVLLPLALDGARRGADAARLRALPPVTDRASARRANAVVAALPYLGVEAPSTTAARTGPLGCDQPLVWASIALQQAGDARFADRADVGMAFCAAARVWGERAAVVEAAIALVRELADAARRVR